MARSVIIQCAHCGGEGRKCTGDVNRAAKAGLRLYCSKQCSALGRRHNKPVDQKRREKAEYDRAYRAKLGESLLVKKRKAYYDLLAAEPEKLRTMQKRNRDARKQDHLEYCRRPEYREWKSRYDRKHRADKFYGPFADASIVLADLETELAERASKYERYRENGTLNKAKKRKISYEHSYSR